MKKKTADEKFLLKLFELAKELGDPSHDIDMFFVGEKISIKEKGVKVIVRNLLQANFIKKGEEENRIYLTSHGLRFIEEMESS